MNNTELILNLLQGIRIQATLKTIYEGVKGQYYGGEEAWEFIKNYSGFDLKEILTKIANKRTLEYGAK
ncbi:type II restriction endonuclease [Tenacibaculum phage PTm1]|uniref:Type II restriction endonuclease n=2 Tax=Shirahamavirus PTm1 TaxID=2846435 RepID=A0A5S9EQL1_9CAUD|nr:type II restriction endonuclease [Tenacibaculum phage PTm1]BBI90615.1 type II restriction endonuclease [Tenacibaculum phage PTm1]BBI90921.1 type II restriction endonuclease [Tenacibaculum phage PTm5]